MNRAVILASALAYAASAQSTYDPDSLAAWEDFFTSTGGPNWGYCKAKKSDPCTCASRDGNAKVQCTEVDGVKYVSDIKLFRAGLTGNFPTDSINAMIAAYPEFASINLLGNGGLNAAPGCVEIPGCLDTVQCQFPPARAVVCTPFSSFFTATGGPSWTLCNDKQNAPCQCRNGQPADAPVKIFCTSSDSITGVRLMNNNLQAAEFPTDYVEDLINGGATEINLSQNPGLAPDAECFDVPSCANEGVECTFDKPVCADTPATDSPTAAATDAPVATEPPSATATPAPSPAVTGTPTLATVAPTAQQEETSSPTTAAPTAEGETLSPTTSPTIAPTTSPSVEATASPSVTSSPTLSPTFEGIRTHAPTESSAGRQMVSQAMALFCAVFAAMMV